MPFFFHMNIRLKQLMFDYEYLIFKKTPDILIF